MAQANNMRSISRPFFLSDVGILFLGALIIYYTHLKPAWIGITSQFLDHVVDSKSARRQISLSVEGVASLFSTGSPSSIHFTTANYAQEKHQNVAYHRGTEHLEHTVQLRTVGYATCG